MLNAKDAPNVSIRLRHLNAIRGCKFATTCTDRETFSGIFFAISLLGQENFGYFYVSETCENVSNPVWDPIDLSGCPHSTLSSKAALFTFFAVLQWDSIVLFELEVHLSGLFLLDAEFYSLHAHCSHCNQVYFQFTNGVYAPPIYLQKQAGASPIPSRANFKAAPRISYNLETVQKFLYFTEVARSQLRLMNSQTEIMLRLKASLSRVLTTEAKREASYVEISLLERRLCTAQRTQRDLQSKLCQLSKERQLVEDKLLHTHQATRLLHTQHSTFSKAISVARCRLSQMNHFLRCRLVVLLREVIDLFDEQLFYGESKRCGPIALDKSTDLNVLHIADQISHASHVCQPTNDTSYQSPNTLTELDLASQDVRPLSVPLESIDVHSLAIGSGFIAHLVRVLSALLNQPLRYPVDFQDGFSKVKIIDRLTLDLSDIERSFPLYLPRSSLLGSYKHALFLLNRDLSVLRANCGFGASNDDSVVYNFREFLKRCVSNPSAVRLT